MDGLEFRSTRMMPKRTMIFLAIALTVSSCAKKKESSTPQAEEGALLRVGSIVVYQSDLDHHLKERHGGRSDAETRKQALDELARRAQFTQAALDAGIDGDPVIRAEVARLLSARLREEKLFPKLKEVAAPISEARLREIYDAQSARFASKEKRQVAVLWLNPGQDPARVAKYKEKLSKARKWFFEESDLADHPEKGFSVLSVDHSEHAASRFKGGVLGWLEGESGATDWMHAVAEIASSIDEPGGVSPVIIRPEGVFLVRLMAIKPSAQRSFESVHAVLEREERDRVRDQLEADFEKDLQAAYPVVYLIR